MVELELKDGTSRKIPVTLPQTVRLAVPAAGPGPDETTAVLGEGVSEPVAVAVPDSGAQVAEEPVPDEDRGEDVARREKADSGIATLVQPELSLVEEEKEGESVLLDVDEPPKVAADEGEEPEAAGGGTAADLSESLPDARGEPEGEMGAAEAGAADAVDLSAMSEELAESGCALERIEGALVDFPHARSNCAQQPFVAGNFANVCSNCYCYVCDVPVSECTGPWEKHCEAVHEDTEWRRAREACRLSGGVHAPSGGAAGATASQVFPPATCVPISCEAMIGAVQQVWPSEAPLPGGVVLPVRRSPSSLLQLLPASQHLLERLSPRSTLGVPAQPARI